MPEELNQPRSCETCKHFLNPFCLVQVGTRCFDNGYPFYEQGKSSLYKEGKEHV